MRKKLPKILVTGGAGFIGSEFVRQSVGKGYETVVVDKLTYAGDLERLKEVKGRYTFYKVDICDRAKLNSIFKRERPVCVIHFSAETHVDRSIQDASPFISTNIMGTQLLLDLGRKYPVKKFIHMSCYDEKTRALTTEGLKAYKDLKIGDRVFSLNPKTRQIELKPIEKIIVQNYKGEMVSFRNERINLIVTPNHRMFILNTSKKNKRLLVETAEIASQRSIFFMPEGYWKGKDETHVDIKGLGRVKTKDVMYILGVFIGDGFTAYQEKKICTKTGLGRREFLVEGRDDKTGRFKKIEKKDDFLSTCRSYRIFFDVPRRDKCRKKVERTLSLLGIKYHCHRGRAGEHIYFTSKTFLDFFNQCGRGAFNKHIPRWALEYSPRFLKFLLEGLMDSDGSRHVVYHTVSSRLVSDVSELCMKLRLKPAFHMRHTKSFINGRKIEGDSYCISVSKTLKSISRHKIKKVYYEGPVWCLQLKDNKNFIVEREGKFDFCGNTDEVYGEIREGRFLETHPLAPNSPYAASKASGDLLVKSYIRTHGFPAIILRPSNNYGPWQYPEKLIPVVVLKALNDHPVPVYKTGQNVREWLHVSDCVNAVLLALENGRLGEVYNIGSGQEKKNIDTVKTILNILGKPESLIHFVLDRPGHDFRYSLDCAKIRALGWRPQVDFQKGIEETVVWNKENFKWLATKLKHLTSYWKKVYRVSR